MLSLTIMNHAFDIECSPEDHDSLQKAADILNKKINEMPASMKNERKIILVALNICYDYLVLKEESLSNSENIEKQLGKLIELLQNNHLENLSLTQK